MLVKAVLTFWPQINCKGRTTALLRDKWIWTETKINRRASGIPKDEKTGCQFFYSKDVVFFRSCSLQRLIHGHVVHFCPSFISHLYVNSMCSSGFCRLLHQPAVRLRCVPGGGSWGSEEGGRQTGPRNARESKGQRSPDVSTSIMHCIGLIVIVL